MSKAKEIAKRLDPDTKNFADQFNLEIESLGNRAKRVEEQLNAEDPQRYEKLRKGAMNILDAVGKYSDAVAQEDSAEAGIDYAFEKNQLLTKLSKMSPKELAAANTENGTIRKFYNKWSSKFDGLSEKYKNEKLARLNGDIAKTAIDAERMRIRKGVENFKALDAQDRVNKVADFIQTGRLPSPETAKEFANRTKDLIFDDPTRKAAMQESRNELFDDLLGVATASKNIEITNTLLNYKNVKYSEAHLEAAARLQRQDGELSSIAKALSGVSDMVKHKIDPKSILETVRKRPGGKQAEMALLKVFGIFGKGNGLAKGQVADVLKDKLAVEARVELEKIGHQLHIRFAENKTEMGQELFGILPGTADSKNRTGNYFKDRDAFAHASSIINGTSTITHVKRQFPQTEDAFLKPELAKAYIKRFPDRATESWLAFHGDQLLQPEELRDMLNVDWQAVDVNLKSIKFDTMLSKIGVNQGADTANAVKHVLGARASFHALKELGIKTSDLSDPEVRQKFTTKVNANYEQLLENYDSSAFIPDSIGTSVKRKFGAYNVGIGGTEVYAERRYVIEEKNLENFKNNISEINNAERMLAAYPFSEEDRDRVRKKWQFRITDHGNNKLLYLESPDGRLHRPELVLKERIGGKEVELRSKAVISDYNMYHTKGSILDPEQSWGKRDGKFSKYAYNRLTPKQKEKADAFKNSEVYGLIQKTSASSGIKQLGTALLLSGKDGNDVIRLTRNAATLSKDLRSVIATQPAIKAKHITIMAHYDKAADEWSKEEMGRLIMGVPPFGDNETYKRALSSLDNFGVLNPRELQHIRVTRTALPEQEGTGATLPERKEISDVRALTAAFGIDAGALHDMLLK